jgi:hypothetical protein
LISRSCEAPSPQEAVFRDGEGSGDDTAPGTKGAVSRAAYSRIVAAYRDRPGNATAVAAAAGVSRHIAERAWIRGWRNRDRSWWGRPVRDVIAEEFTVARAMLSPRAPSEDAKTRAAIVQVVGDARSDLAQSRALQGRSARMARTSGLALQGVLAKLLQGASLVAARLQPMLADGTFSARESMAILRSIAWITREANAAMQIADDLERRALGEPDAILGIAAVMTVEEAERELAEAAKAYARLCGRGRAPVPGAVAATAMDADATS